MFRNHLFIIMLLVSFAVLFPPNETIGKDKIKALYLPLADHYPGIVAYEAYRARMKEADFEIISMPSPFLLRAYFRSKDADMAFIISPMAMDMFVENPNFRWISLIHRDGNALAINHKLNQMVNLPIERKNRLPNNAFANAVTEIKRETGKPVEIAVASHLTTHIVVLYKYLKDHGLEMNMGYGMDKDVLAIEVPPPESPAFLNRKNSRNQPAAFEQSLPWADIVETQGNGNVAWYSKDVMIWPNGHVECIIIAKDRAIREKREALLEVIYYIHKAGVDIEEARREGRQSLLRISKMIRKHIPAHTEDAIAQSLSSDLNVINYYNLNIDKGGLKQIMDYAVEGGILEESININHFSDPSFSTTITVH